MRDVFEDIFTNVAVDPTESARRALRPQLKKRFYTSATAGEGGAILLDGRPIRTPARNLLQAPTPALAQAIAAEWESQASVIDPAKMPLTRLANSIIDGVAHATAEVAADVGKYLGSDMLCYRAAAPDRLVARQAEIWDPILDFARDKLGARFILTEGVGFVNQPDHALAAARAAIPTDPWRLGAVHTVTTLTGSALIALALMRGALTLDEAWRAANLDEDWNFELWGGDDVALRRREGRLAELRAAAFVLEQLREPGAGM